MCGERSPGEPTPGARGGATPTGATGGGGHLAYQGRGESTKKRVDRGQNKAYTPGLRERLSLTTEHCFAVLVLDEELDERRLAERGGEAALLAHRLQLRHG